MANVVESQEPIKEHKNAIGHLEIVFGQVRQTLELAHSVVGKEAHSACRKRR